jgi:hypothetical protein
MAPSAPETIAPQSVARPAAAGAGDAPTITSSTSVTAMAGLRAMTLPPMVRKAVMKTCSRGNEIVAAKVPCATSTQGEAFMAGILLWLMGVPLIVILLLYLIF